MTEEMERALLANINGALQVSRGMPGHDARRILNVILYTLKREGFSISHTFAPGEMTTIELRASA